MSEETFETPQPTQAVTEPKLTNWLKIILVAVLGLGLLTAAAYAGYWYGTQEISNLKDQISNLQPKTQNQITPTPTPAPLFETTPTPTLPVEDETKDWETYRNEGFGFEVKYPPNWSYEDKDFMINFFCVSNCKYPNEEPSGRMLVEFEVGIMDFMDPGGDFMESQKAQQKECEKFYGSSISSFKTASGVEVYKVCGSYVIQLTTIVGGGFRCAFLENQRGNAFDNETANQIVASFSKL